MSVYSHTAPHLELRATVPTKQVGAWALELVWALWRRESNPGRQYITRNGVPA